MGYFCSFIAIDLWLGIYSFIVWVISESKRVKEAKKDVESQSIGHAFKLMHKSLSSADLRFSSKNANATAS